MAEYRLEWFEILTHRRNKIVLYGSGAWSHHLMDWMGLNQHHGRIGPLFNTVEEAYLWLAAEIRAKRLYEGYYSKGHHSGEFQCPKGCDDRTLLDTLYFEDVKRAGKGIPRKVREAAKRHRCYQK